MNRHELGGATLTADPLDPAVSARRKLLDRLEATHNGPPCCTVCDSWLDGGNETGVCDYCARDPYLDGSR